MLLFVHRLPGFAIISHRGRKSGEIHRTPMNVFRDGDDYLFALTYASDVGERRLMPRWAFVGPVMKRVGG